MHARRPFEAQKELFLKRTKHSSQAYGAHEAQACVRAFVHGGGYSPTSSFLVKSEIQARGGYSPAQRLSRFVGNNYIYMGAGLKSLVLDRLKACSFRLFSAGK
jgi:hypothetical protein